MFIIILVWKSKLISPIASKNIAKWSTFLSFFLFLYITYYVLIHLPIIDFRPYAIGKNLPAEMEYVDEKEPAIHDFFLEAEDGEELKDELGDLELGDSFRNEFGEHEVCFICQSDAREHDPRRQDSMR